ncbi:MAG: hypothetical protein PF508_08430 [Spirochaeta sp.]|jgi:hypothetical protein|nr:hypothetical protein [Spirochaeta sp.]
MSTVIAVGALLATVAIQIAFFHVTSLAVAAGIFGGALAVSPAAGLTVRKILTTVRAFLILLAPVLVLQMIVNGASLSMFTSWGTYALRLTAAALVARAYFAWAGVSGVQNGLDPFLRLLPRRAADPFRLILTGSLFLLPLVLLQLQNTIHAGLLRYRAGTPPQRRGKQHRTELFTVYPAILRAIVLNVLRIPEQRAGAMVVRGVLAETAAPAPGKSRPQTEAIR